MCQTTQSDTPRWIVIGPNVEPTQIAGPRPLRMTGPSRQIQQGSLSAQSTSTSVSNHAQNHGLSNTNYRAEDWTASCRRHLLYFVFGEYFLKRSSRTSIGYRSKWLFGNKRKQEPRRVGRPMHIADAERDPRPIDIRLERCSGGSSTRIRSDIATSR